MAKIYDIVKEILIEYPQTRDSDKRLLWAFYLKKGYLQYTERHEAYILRDNFYKAPTPESVTRCRRKIQEKHPQLRSTVQVQEVKDEKESTKGTFIYHEE